MKFEELTPITERGVRGEAVYRLKTASSDITVDGVKDEAYEGGLHIGGIYANDEEYYKDRPTRLDVYLTRGKNGRLYFFGSVTDPEIIVKESFFNGRVDECDGIKIYIDADNSGIKASHNYRILPYCGEETYNRMPPDTKVILTDKGFDFECSLDNGGVPFKDGDCISFTVYYLDSNDFVSDNEFSTHIIKIPSSTDHFAKSFPVPVYHAPSSVLYDTLLFSDKSVDEETNAPKTLSGNILADILAGEATVSVISGGKHAAIQTITAALETHRYLRSLGARSTFINNAAPGGDISFDYEIVFNNSTLNGGNPLFDSLKCDEWGIESKGNKIFVSAPLEKGAAAAKERLFAIIDEAKNGTFPEMISERGKAEVDTVTENIPVPECFDLISDVGDGAYMYLKLDACKDDLTDYRSKLKDGGFSPYTENSFGRIVTYTYTGHGAVITVVYSDNCAEGLASSLRIVVEPMRKTALPPLTPEPYEKKLTPQLTMLSFVGLCLVYRLANGEFVILDGGCAHQCDRLYEFLMREGDGHPVVAAWLLSHFHQDHAGVFARLADTPDLLKNIKIKSIIYNFPQKLVSDTAKNTTDIANLRKWSTLLQNTGAKIYQARTGQKYYFAGMEVELLWTFEDIMPYLIFGDDTNPTCTGYRVTIEGQTHMLLGDSSEEELRQAYKRIGTYLKSDLVQLAHHGMGSAKSPVELYKLVDAETVLIPGTKAGRYSEKWAASNAKSVYNAAGSDVTLALPYFAK